MRGGARNAVAGRDEGQSVSSTRLPAISTTAVTMHPVPMDGTDGKVANEPSRVRVSVVEPSGTWTFGLGKNRDIQERRKKRGKWLICASHVLQVVF